MEFEDAWLEVRTCVGGTQPTEANHIMLEVPAISEVLEAAVNASKHHGMWDYSRRLALAELEAIQGALQPTKTSEDGRSISHSLNVTYKGSCYTLTLFAVKRSQ